MRKEFLEHLAASGVVPAGSLSDLHYVLRGAREPIGAIAFRYGMITGSDIDLVLEEQRHSYRRFGEIAMSMGLLTRAQVETLVRIQHLRLVTETAEALVLAGICPLHRVTIELGRFLVRQELPVACLDS
jgi:hypothetical protein